MNHSEAGSLGYQKSQEKLKAFSQSLHELAIARWRLKGKVCLQCKIIISFEKRDCKFCSHSCSAKFSNHLRYKPAKIRLCIKCRSEWIREAHSRSLACKNCRLKINKEPSLEEARTNQTRRKILIKEVGHYCWKCKLSKWQEIIIPLELEHKNGNSDDHRRENLEILCPNCHALTPTYKGRNKGYGRFKRRQRYLEGKSY